MKKHNLHAENDHEPKSAVNSAGQVKHTRSLSFHLLIPRLVIDHLVEWRLGVGVQIKEKEVKESRRKEWGKERRHWEVNFLTHSQSLKSSY